MFFPALNLSLFAEAEQLVYCARRGVRVVLCYNLWLLEEPPNQGDTCEHFCHPRVVAEGMYEAF